MARREHNRPLIGVTTSARSGWRIFPLVAFNLWLVGGRGIRWGAGRPADLDAVDGLIIGGGDDIAPALYGGEIVAEAVLEPQRDALERTLAEAALTRGIPVLGICRGAQMLNIAAGGTLMGDAFARHPESRKVRTILPRRIVSVSADSWLRRITGRDTLKVNALHSQAVDRLGNGLRVGARDGGGMVQAIESTRDPFALGVQWHPEHLFYRAAHRRLFTALVAAARERRLERHGNGRQRAAVAGALKPSG
ncbi:putative glutamine amidotransferase [Aliiruegeria haliotis]|uniref:Putative glutamine amidotransferase n=1 Tax=Aliiruegeria haliotis TaxID=1280846 RepID=A0A2T0RPR3_9RHOB|nr:gamma-glutamyl-gamma-aminobutyrate hydrolase family protein [Aliiruegeria haliotis]PRY23132.1 putative glutamine amidotransferase [Aliiruegeria haliotis]